MACYTLTEQNYYYSLLEDMRNYDNIYTNLDKFLELLRIETTTEKKIKKQDLTINQIYRNELKIEKDKFMKFLENPSKGYSIISNDYVSFKRRKNKIFFRIYIDSYLEQKIEDLWKPCEKQVLSIIRTNKIFILENKDKILNWFNEQEKLIDLREKESLKNYSIKFNDYKVNWGKGYSLCECGKEYQKSNKVKHIITKHHKEWLKKQEELKSNT